MREGSSALWLPVNRKQWTFLFTLSSIKERILSRTGSKIRDVNFRALDGSRTKWPHLVSFEEWLQEYHLLKRYFFDPNLKRISNIQIRFIFFVHNFCGLLPWLEVRFSRIQCKIFHIWLPICRIEWNTSQWSIKRTSKFGLVWWSELLLVSITLS